MSNFTSDNGRRNFLKIFGLSSLPLVAPFGGSASSLTQYLEPEKEPAEDLLVNFISDGLFFSPHDYMEELTKINAAKAIEPDFYGNGGATHELEDAFAKATGKAKAMFFPTGTMANQLAMKMLNGENTKIIVPENSHIYRDEADAAQAVHGKRLIPAGKGKAFYTLQDLKDTIAYHDNGEVFKSGLGTVVIESPVRRADGVAVPLETIKEISAYCKEKGYKLHLDGARLHLASAYTGVSIAEYASYFDTVYISLYKYLNAGHGAMLCGDAALLEKMSHQVKIYGGVTYQTWQSASVALRYFNGIAERWKNVVQMADQLVAELNKIKGVRITRIENGTNIYNLALDSRISLKKMAGVLYNEYSMILGRATDGVVKMQMNESLTRRDVPFIVDAWKKAIEDGSK